ncbi:MAG: hypothetical protein WBB19_13775 [Desulforhopalus sp.]
MILLMAVEAMIISLADLEVIRFMEEVGMILSLVGLDFLGT